MRCYALDVEFETKVCMALALYFYKQQEHDVEVDLPIVAICYAENVFSANQRSSEVFPTLVSPMIINLIKWS